MPSRTLPSDIAYDPTYIRIWDASGTELGDSQFNFENGEIYFFGFYSQKFVVRLKLIESEDMSKLSYTSLCKKREILVCPKRILSLPEGRGFLYYGGESGAQIIMLKPNPEYGFEYLSENNIIRKDYGQTISSVVEYSDGYLVFSAETIKKWRCRRMNPEPRFFSLKALRAISVRICRAAYAVFDDKIIFANSQGGVFYINKFGIEERDVSRHISSVIEQGEKGFFSHTSAEYDAAAAVCAFGKYMLTVGNITYIWDYTARLPSATQSREDENKMVWTLNDVVTPFYLPAPDYAKAVFYRSDDGRYPLPAWRRFRFGYDRFARDDSRKRFGHERKKNDSFSRCALSRRRRGHTEAFL